MAAKGPRQADRGLLAHLRRGIVAQQPSSAAAVPGRYDASASHPLLADVSPGPEDGSAMVQRSLSPARACPSAGSSTDLPSEHPPWQGRGSGRRHVFLTLCRGQGMARPPMSTLLPAGPCSSDAAEGRGPGASLYPRRALWGRVAGLGRLRRPGNHSVLRHACLCSMPPSGQLPYCERVARQRLKDSKTHHP